MVWGMGVGRLIFQGQQVNKFRGQQIKNLPHKCGSRMSAFFTITSMAPPYFASPPHLLQSKNLHSEHVPMGSWCCCFRTTLCELLFYKDIRITKNHVMSRILTIRESVKGLCQDTLLSPHRETYGIRQRVSHFIVYCNYLGDWEKYNVLGIPRDSESIDSGWDSEIMCFNKCQKCFWVKWSKDPLQKHWYRVKSAVQLGLTLGLLINFSEV